MPTNKIALRTVEQFMSDYTPTYQPIYPLFMGKSQAYDSEVGKHEFRRVSAVSDIRAKHLTPKDTEIRQIAVMEGKKTFKKYFLSNQYQHSNFQDSQGLEEVVSQVLDEHQKQMDELFLLGEGTSDSTMLNNGLFWSGDANYELKNSDEIDATDRLIEFHTNVVASAIEADQLAGQKVIIFYGTGVLPLWRSLHSSSSRAVRAVLAESLPSFRFVELPAAITPSSTNGWIVANLDQVKLHHTALPSLMNQGVNEEKHYSWHNFLMGSCMLEVLADKAIIRQPVTLE